jgi:cytochrome c-type biogenesis protein CcmE
MTKRNRRRLMVAFAVIAGLSLVLSTLASAFFLY